MAKQARFELKDRVVVTRVTDEMGNPSNVGRIGVVDHVIEDCGDGAVLYDVAFEDERDDPNNRFWGDLESDTELNHSAHWAEELEAVK